MGKAAGSLGEPAATRAPRRMHWPSIFSLGVR
jgi:hypothetical protein